MVLNRVKVKEVKEVIEKYRIKVSVTLISAIQKNKYLVILVKTVILRKKNWLLSLEYQK